MEIDDAIRQRRTVKDYRDEPVQRELIAELLDLAVLAPNHHLTEPWRFWVLGRPMLERLIEATGDRKLLRSPVAVAAGMVLSDDPREAEEDYASLACALQNAMLAARGRGLASYWRTPAVIAQPTFAEVIGAPANVRLAGLLHLGWPSIDWPPTPERDSTPFTTWLV